MIEYFRSHYNNFQSEVIILFEKLSLLEEEVFAGRQNDQQRTIKQIIGHMLDSASNNTHRIVHLQYQESPLNFPNYATDGNNDRWIAIQNYKEEDWMTLLNCWKYSHLHLLHVIENIDNSKLNKTWIAGPGTSETLKEMVIDFPRHFNLHVQEINQLIVNS